MTQITHLLDPTGYYVQIVPPAVLRDVLDAAGDTYDRPSWLRPGDEWIVASSTD